MECRRPGQKRQGRGGRESVYNRHVAEYHTYFVGGRDWGFSIRAHNVYSGNSEVNLRRRLDYAGSDEDLANEIVQRGAGEDVSAEIGDQWASHWRSRTINDLQALPPKEQAAALDQAAQEHGLPAQADPLARLRYDQETAGLIAREFGNHQCSECARDIVRALGPNANAQVLRLEVAQGFVQVMGAPVGEGGEVINISWTGHHVGVDVGGFVFDNHNAEGMAVREWTHFVQAPGPLVETNRPVGAFFDASGNALDSELSEFLSR